MFSIPVVIIKAAILDRKLRSALRLFYWFKANCAHVFVLDSALLDKLSTCFSRYEIDTHVKYLRENNWINFDERGQIFLQGSAFYTVKFKIQTKKYQRRKISSDDLATRHAWYCFLAGSAIGKVYASVKHTTKKSVRDALTVLHKVEDDRSGLPGLIPLSLACIMSLGISQTTASRMRKEAAKSGHISHQHQFYKYTTTANPDGISCTYKEWLEIRGDMAYQIGAAEASKIVWRRGMVFIQLPSLVAPNFRFSKTKTFFKAA